MKRVNEARVNVAIKLLQASTLIWTFLCIKNTALDSIQKHFPCF